MPCQSMVNIEVFEEFSLLGLPLDAPWMIFLFLVPPVVPLGMPLGALEALLEPLRLAWGCPWCPLAAPMSLCGPPPGTRFGSWRASGTVWSQKWVRDPSRVTFEGLLRPCWEHFGSILSTFKEDSKTPKGLPRLAVSILWNLPKTFIRDVASCILMWE